jgi:hypothetical protein
MSRACFLLSVVGWACVVAGTGTALGQQVQLTNPYHQLSDSFYENFGLGWGMSGRGFFFNTGAMNSTPPPFGGYDPGNDAMFGGFMRGGGFSFGFGLSAGTGSTRTNTVTSPTIVMPNGGTAGLFDGSQRPFVTGVIPVVGGGVFQGATPGVRSSYPTAVSPLQERLARIQQGETPPARRSATARDPQDTAPEALEKSEDSPLVLRGGGKDAGPDAGPRGTAGGSAGSTAAQGDISVAEIRRQQAAGDDSQRAELLDRLEKARSCEEAGKLSSAKVYYQQAAARATGDLKQQLLEKIRSLGVPSSR